MSIGNFPSRPIFLSIFSPGTRKGHCKGSMGKMRTKKLMAVVKQLRRLYPENKFETRRVNHSTMIIKDGDQFWGWVDDDGNIDPSLLAKLSKD